MDALSERPPSGVKNLTLAQENLRDLAEEQLQEGLRRELFAPFDSADFEPPVNEFVEYRGVEVEVTDPMPQKVDVEALQRSVALNRLLALKRRINTETFEDTVQEVFDEAFNIMVERQKKYGPNNVTKAGLYGLFTRLEDKMERIKRSMNGRIINGEIILDDSVALPDEAEDDGDFDALNYHAIRILLRRGKWGKPLAEDAGFSQ